MLTTSGPHPAKTARPVRLATSDSVAQQLDVETRRALALLRAANLTGNPEAIRALLRLCGRTDAANESGQIRIHSSDVKALAGALRRRGHPLTDGGVKAFKMERGLSDVVRIGPEVATAYARMAQGRDARVSIDPVVLASLPHEEQRALKLIGIIARRPEDVVALARALGSESSDLSTHGAALAGLLATWARAHRVPFTSEGMTRLAHVMEWPAAVLDERLARFFCDSVVARGEPEHDYTRLTSDGCTLSKRTVRMLSMTEQLLGGVVIKVQKGSYVDDNGRGAHPHVAGGVVDLSTRNLAHDEVERFVSALRQVGFAAWYRPRPDRPHIHAIAIGDREMSPAAEWQVKQYFAGRDGRSRMARDPHGGPKLAPAWAQKYRLALAA